MNKIFLIVFLFLSSFLNGQELMLNFGHDRSVDDMDISVDGKHLLTMGYEGKAKLWDIEKKQLLRNYFPHQVFGLFAELSPDGQYVYTIGADNILRKLNKENGEVVLSKNINVPLRAKIVLSPDGKYLAKAGIDGIIEILETTNLEQVHQINGLVPYLYDLSFNKDGTRLVSGGKDYGINVYDTKTWKVIFSTRKNENTIRQVLFSPDEKYIVAKIYNYGIPVFDASNGRWLHNLECAENAIEPSQSNDVNDKARHCKYVDHIVVSADGAYVYGKQKIGELLFKWQLSDGKLVKIWEEESLKGKAFYLDTKERLFGGDYKGTVGYFDFKKEVFVSLSNEPFSITSASFTNGDKSFKCYNRDGDILDVELSEGKADIKKSKFEAGFSTLSVPHFLTTEDHRFVLTTNYSWKFHDTKKDQPIRLATRGIKMTHAKARISDDQNYFAYSDYKGLYYTKLGDEIDFQLLEAKFSGNWDFLNNNQIIFSPRRMDTTTIQVYDLLTKEILWAWSPNYAGWCNAFAIDPSGQNLAIVSHEKVVSRKEDKNEIILLQLGDKSIKTRFPIEKGGQVHWINDTLLMTSGFLSTIKIWNPYTHQLIHDLEKGYTSAIVKDNILSSPTGQHMALIDADQGLRIYDVKKNEFWVLEDASFQFVTSLDISKDGKYLLFVNSFNEVNVLDLDNRRITAQYAFCKQGEEVISIARNGEKLSTNYKGVPENLMYNIKGIQTKPLKESKFNYQLIWK